MGDFLRFGHILQYVNSLIEKAFRAVLGLFVKIKRKQASAIARETLLVRRCFDRRFLGDELFTVPNIFSLSRIPLGFILFAMIAYGVVSFWVILAVHGIAIITDRLDGVWARLEGETTIGAILDPLCDKIYFTACAAPYYSLVLPGIFWPLLALEIALAATPFVAVAKIKTGKLSHETDFRANIFGKVKFFLEFIALLLLAANSSAIANAFLLAALFFAVFSIWKRIAGELKLARRKTDD